MDLVGEVHLVALIASITQKVHAAWRRQDMQQVQFREPDMYMQFSACKTPEASYVVCAVQKVHAIHLRHYMHRVQFTQCMQHS